MSNSVFSKKNNVGLGLGLFNETSKELVAEQERKDNEKFKIEYINIWNLLPNEKNKDFSMDEIEDLKASILDVGLQQNLVVTPYKEGQYKILTGHRRREALFQLIQEGHKELLNVPCIVRNFDDIDLPLSDDLKEIYAIATTNAEVRQLTDADKLKLMNMLSTVYDELKEQGYAKLGKRRDYIAEKLGVSSSTVKILSFVDNNLNEDIKEDFKNKKIPLTVANEIAHLDEKEQTKLIEKNEGDISNLTASDIKEHRKALEEKQTQQKKKSNSKIDTGSYGISASDFEYIFNLSDKIDELPNGVTVSGKEFDKLLLAKERILTQQHKIEKILDNAMKKYK